MLPATSSTHQRLTFGLHLLYATGLRLSEVVAATVDDLQWVECPADASDDQPHGGLAAAGDRQGAEEREVPLPADVIGELAQYLVSRGLDARIRRTSATRARSCSARPATRRARAGAESPGRHSTPGRDRSDHVL
jgi:integrase